jgi:hypothetical protein
MMTYLTITFDTEGGRPSEVATRLQALGFRPVKGNYDFVYEWGGTAVSVEDALALADRVHETLRGLRVFFQIETV